MPKAPTKEGPATAAAPVTRAARAPDVDRLMCASAWLEPWFAHYLFRALFRPGLRATAPAYGVDLVALARHARAARRYRLWMILIAVALVLVALVSLILVLPNLVTALLILLGAAALLVVLVGVHLYLTRARATRIFRDPRPPGHDLPPLDPQLHDRLSALADPNVVVFDGKLPFVGAGALLENWSVRVNTTKAATDDNGNKKTIIPVRAEELQKKLTLAIRAANIAGIEVHNRMFVAGHRVRRISGLLPDPMGPPLSRLDRKQIRQAIEGSTESARTYLCVEKTSWQGELVVNIFVRAKKSATGLNVYYYAFVLLPLHPDITAAERLPVAVFGRLIGVLRDVFGVTARIVKGSPRWAWEICRWRWQIYRGPVRERRDVRRMPSFNYGAPKGVRALVAAKQQEWLFAYEDEDADVQELRDLVLSNVVEYMRDHGIDTSDLEKRQSQIIMKTIKIGDINAKNVMVGDHNSLNDLASGWANGQDKDDDDQTVQDDDDEGKS